ncbi:unnamed protein product [Callosobruchus maculatus]|uniref:Uncharacterized protein n=1 Tax=Callosobruchus maculatus TaxID=64391 RepID=A0A653D8G0_CALMS|nr:unnamed protein product [Callosobruchus maculatus]
MCSEIDTPNLGKDLHSLEHRRSLFYRFYHGRCSSELSQIITPQAVRTRNTREALRAHPYQVEVLTPRTSLLQRSFFWRTSTLWNQLPGELFPDGYNLQRFKSNGFIGWQISQAQAGFVKGRGTHEQILNLRQIIEKTREHCFPIFICFVDYSKAFDNQLYESSSVRVRIDGNLSGQTAIRKGVRQRCVLSPMLFNIYSEFVMRQVLDNWNGEQHSAAYGLGINYRTKIIIVDREHDNHREIKLIGRCEVVQSFVYLGSLIDNSGSCENEIRRRIQQAQVAMTKLKLKSLVFSIFLSALETWTVKKADRARIDAFEMWTWRRMLRIPYTAHQINVSILDVQSFPYKMSPKSRVSVHK